MTGALAQGAQFAEMTRTLHGGTRNFKRLNKKMRGTRRRQSGGSFFTPYADYSTEFNMQLPSNLHDAARITPLDAKFAELPAIERAAMAGGSRQNQRQQRQSQRQNQRQQQRQNQRQSRRQNQRQNGGTAPVDEPAMLLRTPTEEMDARLNPQWYTENTVIPNFQGPIPVPGGTVAAPLAPAPPTPKVGGKRRSSRKNRRNNRRY